MNPTKTEVALPWYRFFWPWFIVILMTMSVAGAIATVVIAFRNQDSLVDDRYYETGNAINQRLAAEANAARLGIRAILTIDELTGEVLIALDGNLETIPERLRLTLSHATRESRDEAIELSSSGADRFYGQLDAPPAGRYYVNLRPSESLAEIRGGTAEAWRLQREIRLPSREPLPLGTGP